MRKHLHVTLPPERMAMLRELALRHGYRSVARFSAAVLWGTVLRAAACGSPAETEGSGADTIAGEFAGLSEWELDADHVYAPDIRKRR